MYAISILDDVIATIRSSENKKNAKERLKEQYQFSEEQAEAIVMLQLYRLTNTDITDLEKEADELKKKISELTAILEDEKKLFQVIKKDLKTVKKNYKTERRTKIESEIEDIKINLEVMVPSEEVVVSITKEGYIKRTSIRSYAASNMEDLQMKDNDQIIHVLEINTTDTLLLFTNKGHYLYIPVHELPDIKWKDMGQHIANIIPIDREESIIKAIPIRDFNEQQYILTVSKNGMIKKSDLAAHKVQRYSKPITAMKLKGDDELVNVHLTNGHQDLFLASNTGYGLWYHESELKSVGVKTAGVKSMTLKDGEYVVNGEVFDDLQLPSLFVITQRGACKRMSISEFEMSSRAKTRINYAKRIKAESTPHHRVLSSQ